MPLADIADYPFGEGKISNSCARVERADLDFEGSSAFPGAIPSFGAGGHCTQNYARAFCWPPFHVGDNLIY